MTGRRSVILRFVLIASLVALFGAVRASSAEGVRGRASLAGVLVEGVEVRVYPYRPGSFGPLTGVAPAARALTGTDGAYEAAVPSGRYVVEALKKGEGLVGQRPETGDLHCLYSGSPVTVTPGAWTAVGVNLVKVVAEERKAAAQSVLQGRITAKGREVEKVYLYVYDEVGSVFHGPARVLQPVARGSFRVRVPPGTYYLVARKRARGGAYGPIEIGDLFNFYPRNPVVVAQGEEVQVEIPLIERLSQLEEDVQAFQGVQLRVVDATGKAAPGYYVLAYGSALRTGPPLAASLSTDGEGRTRLPLPPGQPAFLRARRALGGPLGDGDWYADGTAAAGGTAEVTLQLKRRK
ncbi:MAG: hypothetical protein HY900_12150 [Deltaproteobacteria bacterium]|nr:hypothetical protein [Deltaproteobacteria bacterium]